MTGKTQGQIAYEADVAMRPLYHDGSPRKRWDQLPEIGRWSWERCAAENRKPGGVAQDEGKP